MTVDTYIITASPSHQAPLLSETVIGTLDEAKAEAEKLSGCCYVGEGWIQVSVPGKYAPTVPILEARVTSGPLRWRTIYH